MGYFTQHVGHQIMLLQRYLIFWSIIVIFVPQMNSAFWEIPFVFVHLKVINNKGYNGAKADLWSCGVILFVLMAGFLPFEEPNLMTLYKKVNFYVILAIEFDAFFIIIPKMSSTWVGGKS